MNRRRHCLMSTVTGVVLILVLSACSGSGSATVQNDITATATPTATAPTTEPFNGVQVAPGAPTASNAESFSDSGDITMTNSAGYTATISYQVTVSDFQKTIVDDAPGQASISYSADAQASVANTTSGRANPSSFRWGAIALYPISSNVCTVTKMLTTKTNTAAGNDGPASMPTIQRSETGAAVFCSLPLGSPLLYGPTNYPKSSPLEPGQVAPLENVPSATTQVATVISGIPEASVPSLIAELQVPTKIVYIVTGTGGFMDSSVSTNSIVSFPTGEHCNIYEHYYPQTPNMTTTATVGIFVPSLYAPIC